jgi:hypothetical protein
MHFVSTRINKSEIVLVLFVLIVAIAPFWCVEFLPSTDLPQHLSQMHLFEQTIAGARHDLTITPWYYPNTLIYFFLYLFWKVVPPLAAGKLILSSLAASWILATYALAKSRNRPFEHWLITVPITFNFLFSWGLLNFLIGWPIFCLFFIIASASPSKYQIAKLAGCALLLYYAHALWFLFGNVWLIAKYLDQRSSSWKLSLTALIPAWSAALIWYPQLSTFREASGVGTGLIWKTMPFDRLNLEYATNSAMGVLHGSIEAGFFLFLVGWIGLALYMHRKNLAAQVDQPLLTAALIFILAYWTLPWQYMNTIYFNQRWFPSGLILLLLALPAPKLRPAVLLAAGGLWIFFFSFMTIKAYGEWEDEQLGGFSAALNQIDERDRIFGLNMMDGSMYIKGSPGLQLFSYAQALKGAETNFSFTEHYSGVVQYKTPPQPSKIRRFVHSPLLTLPKHLAGFNKVLVNGDEELQEFAQKRLNLEITAPTKQTWRLYTLKSPTP